MKRKMMGAFALAAASSMLLAGCSGSGGDAPASSNAPDPTEKIELTVSVWNLDGTPEFQALFDAFEAKHENITIKPVDILTDDYTEKVTTMLAGGDKTDVITMKNAIDYARYAGRGQLADVSDLAKSYGPELAGLDTFNTDGTYYALPYRQDFWLLYYNKAMFDAAGIDYPDNITWDQYAEYAEKLTKKDGDKIVYGAYHHTWRSVVQAISAAQTGGDLLNGDYGFMKPQYDLALGLQDKGFAMNYASAKTQQISYRNVFETEQAAMVPMGSWYIAGIKQVIDEGKSTVDWGVAQMPQLKADGNITTFGSPTAFAVNKNAAHADAAKLFLDFAAGEEGAKAIAAIGVVPAYSSEAVTAAFTALPEDELSKKAYQGDKTVIIEMPVSDKTADISTILDEEHDLVMVGERSADDGIKEMQDRVKNEVD